MMAMTLEFIWWRKVKQIALHVVISDYNILTKGESEQTKMMAMVMEFGGDGTFYYY